MRPRRHSFPGSTWSGSHRCSRRRSGTAASTTNARSSRCPSTRAATSADAEVDAPGDLADVSGNDDAVEGMHVAAAGGHHVYLLGPPGAGKTMLASRLPGILPDLDADAALEVASIRSLAGMRPARGSRSGRPTRRPHHTATAAAIVGGGSRLIRPGAAARASHGVLFLDEAPEFPSAVLDVLRQPLESGTIAIHRANAVASFPARFQLVLAANPCPCGNDGTAECTCPPIARRRYLGRISGPLLDRVDVQLRVPRITWRRCGPRARNPASRAPTRGRRSSQHGRSPPSDFAAHPGAPTPRCPGRGCVAQAVSTPAVARSRPSTGRSSAAASPCAATTAC